MCGGMGPWKAPVYILTPLLVEAPSWSHVLWLNHHERDLGEGGVLPTCADRAAWRLRWGLLDPCV